MSSARPNTAPARLKKRIYSADDRLDWPSERTSRCHRGGSCWFTSAAGCDDKYVGHSRRLGGAGESMSLVRGICGYGEVVAGIGAGLWEGLDRSRFPRAAGARPVYARDAIEYAAGSDEHRLAAVRRQCRSKNRIPEVGDLNVISCLSGRGVGSLGRTSTDGLKISSMVGLVGAANDGSR